MQSFGDFLLALCSLYYVPTQNVVTTYYQVIVPLIEEVLSQDQDWEELSEEIGQFGYYFTETWIEKHTGRQALFSPELYSRSIMKQ